MIEQENFRPRPSSKHIISAKSIQIHKQLGVGEFGVVQQGVWQSEDGDHVQVAIKRLNKERMQNNAQEFLKEANIMHSIDCEHIVRLYGVVFEEDALMLVTELAPLRSLLECLKEPALRSTFTALSLCEFAQQICDGMAYLESKRLIHRDLAARNILVFSKNKVKISDFGLSRALGVGKDYYQANYNVNLKLPIAWCAPECINFLKFTSASDVWAYGVTLWEMFSYGFQPWAALTGSQILEAIDEPNCQRLEQPASCPKEYYSMMLKCWQHDPNKRPRFSEIQAMLPDCRPEVVQAIHDSDIYVQQQQLQQTQQQHQQQQQQRANSATPTKSTPSKDLLNYKVGDLITVLDKKPSRISSTSSASSHGCSNLLIDSAATGLDNRRSESPNSSHSLPLDNDHTIYWKGVLNSGKVGLFNPSHTIAYLGQNLPASSNSSLSSSVSAPSSNSNTLSSNANGVNNGSAGGSTGNKVASLASNVLQNNFLRGILKSKYANMLPNGNHYSSSKRKLRPDMISRPQGDLKHTGHVGVDGVFFGDVGFLGEQYSDLSKTNPAVNGSRNHPEKSSSIDLARTASDLSDKAPLLTKSTKTGHLGSTSSSSDGRHRSLSDTDDNITNAHHVINLNRPKRGGVINPLGINLNGKAVGRTPGAGPNGTDHEYHEITDEEDFCSLESPHFETLDFGPSLMDEVFKELETIKPEFTSDLTEHQQAINDCNSNVKNEIKEMASKMALKDAQNKQTGRKHSSVKPISAADQMTLDSAISLAKELASRSMLELDADHENGPLLTESPKTPTSPNKKKIQFSFKFSRSPKAEKRCFSQEAESIPTVEETITEEAKEAYAKLVERGEGLSSDEDKKAVSDNTRSCGVTNVVLKKVNGQQQTVGMPCPIESSEIENDNHSLASSQASVNTVTGEENPLRLLRNGATVVPKFRGNKGAGNNRVAYTPQTAGLARMAANATRSNLGAPPPVPTCGAANGQDPAAGSADNPLPLPPRDRTKPLPVLKHHQRKYPLIIPSPNFPGASNSLNASSSEDSLANDSNSLPYVRSSYPVLKQVSCPEPPADFALNYSVQRASSFNKPALTDTATSQNSFSSQGKAKAAPAPPPPKPARTCSAADSFETQIQAAIDNLDTIGTDLGSDSPPASNSSHASDHRVSCEDLLDFAADRPANRLALSAPKVKGPDSDEVRVMQKVLGSEVQVTPEECVAILNDTEWDVHRAIKCVRLRQSLRAQSFNMEVNWAKMLSKFNWNVRQTTNYLIATQGVSGDTTEV